MPSLPRLPLLLRSRLGRFFHQSALLALVATGVGQREAAAQAGWPVVEPADFNKLSLNDFADHELEVPYFLYHFSRVANAVVETGPNRGFLNLAVNRPPLYNAPYNARIMEMQMALAYFYATNRPWNRYYGDSAVRVRLEAMLQRWSEIPNADGLLAEYSPTNFGLAPTGFGSMAASQALELIIRSGLPFDAAVIERARAALRKALVALFTRADMKRDARQYSNQLSGSFSAALRYLSLWPDAELEALTSAALVYACENDQSPAGFHYEQGGADVGYSTVHDTNLRVARPFLLNKPVMLAAVEAADRRWNEWLSANLIPYSLSGVPGYLANAGINTRTSQATQIAGVRPYAENVLAARPFAFNEDEFRASRVQRRADLVSLFGKWSPLSVPNEYSYIPSFVYESVRELNPWQPTFAQREAAVAALPYFAASRFNRIFHDPWPVTVSTFRRPNYYAVFNSGSLRLVRQNYGLGLLWNPVYGPALQTVAGTTWIWGTRPAGSSSLYEGSEVRAQLALGPAPISPAPGVTTVPDGDFSARYALGNAGTKTVHFGDDGITVTVEHTGAFEEVVPLLYNTDSTLEASPREVIYRRPNGGVLALTITSAGGSVTLGSPGNIVPSLRRRSAVITASGSLTYRLRVAANAQDLLGSGTLVNLSTRGQVGTGDAIMIAGFVVENDTRRVLIRAVGPSLGQFGVTGFLNDPILTVYRSGMASAIASNDNWGSTPELITVGANAGAFALVAQSADAALLTTLTPGAYTVHVSGKDQGTGVALLEVYQR